MSSSGDEADYIAAGLYDPAAPDAANRLALLDYLAGIGATIDDMQSRAAELGSLSFDLGIWPTRERLTLSEVAAGAGVDPALVVRAWRAVGLAEPAPDDRVFVEADIEMLAVIGAATDFLGEDVLWSLARVIGHAAARIADASVSAFVTGAGPAALGGPDGELALARANAEAVGFLDVFGRVFNIVFRHHVEVSRRPVEELMSRPGVEVRRRTVGFADLVDSTASGERSTVEDLSVALSAFDEAASQIVTGRHGRVVKLIGDEALFANADAGAAVDTALTLIDAFTDHPLLPPVRVGLASGDVLTRDGDVYGTVVNRAARAVKLAPVSGLLVDDGTAQALSASEYRLEDTGAHAMKGITQPVRLWLVTRAQ